MISTETIVYQFLTKTGTPLYDSVGKRVWFPIAHSSWINETNAITFQELAGASPYHAAEIKTIYEFKCFGGSNQYGPEDELYNLLFHRLQGNGEKMMGGEIISAVELSRSKLEDPEKKYKMKRGSFAITFKNE